MDHSQSQSDSSSQSRSNSSASQDARASFNGSSLTIKGAQIIAWLSTIVPKCPPLDDPGLATKSSDKPAAQPAAAAQPVPAAVH